MEMPVLMEAVEDMRRELRILPVPPAEVSQRQEKQGLHHLPVVIVFPEDTVIPVTHLKSMGMAEELCPGVYKMDNLVQLSSLT